MTGNTERVLLCVVAALLMGGLIGCGGGGTPTDDVGVAQIGEQTVAQPGPDGRVRVLIALRSAPGNADREMVSNAGGSVRHMFRHVDGMSADLPEQAIEALKRNPRVESVEPAPLVYALSEDDGQVVPWGVDRIDARYYGPDNERRLPDGANRGKGALVAIIDTGIDYEHPDLEPNMDRDNRGYDFVNDNDDPMDDDGHGTHVAGTVAAADRPGEYGVVGVAAEARLRAYKVLGAGGSGSLDDVIAAIERCIDDGDVDVINMSLGSDSGNELLEAACQEAEKAGIVLVAAAGNSGNPPGRGDNVAYPARYDTVIAVAATDIGDRRTRWSSTGPDLELCAPGNNIYSTWLQDAGEPIGYATRGGTSMAAPHVSGAAALAVADLLSGQDVRAHLIETAEDLGGDPNHYGDGLVSADGAAGWDGPTVTIHSPKHDAEFEEDEMIYFEGEAFDADGKGVSEWIVWTSNLEQEEIGTGESVSSDWLSVGEHVITAAVTDSGGTGADSITITVGPSEPTEPTVTISSPDHGDEFEEGEMIYFEGKASDDQDGDLSSDLTWISSEDGRIGTGASFSSDALRVGEHVITAEVTNSADLKGSDSIIITVVAEVDDPGELGELSVDVSTDRDSYSHGDTVEITVTVVEDADTNIAVPGASVDVTVSTPRNRTHRYSATTGDNGEAVVTHRVNTGRDGSGTYKVEATVSADGYEEGSGETKKFEA